jgi:hypothetical protein
MKRRDLERKLRIAAVPRHSEIKENLARKILKSMNAD